MRVRNASAHNMLPNLGPVLLALLCNTFLLVTLSLCGSDVSCRWLCIGVVVLRDFLPLLLEDPVVLVIVVVASLVHEVLENLAHVVVVWALLELQVATVLQVGVELFRESTSQCLDGRLHLFVLNPVILVVLVLSLEALPRQTAFQKVDQDETNAFQVVSA